MRVLDAFPEEKSESEPEFTRQQLQRQQAKIWRPLRNEEGNAIRHANFNARARSEVSWGNFFIRIFDLGTDFEKRTNFTSGVFPLTRSSSVLYEILQEVDTDWMKITEMQMIASRNFHRLLG